MPDSPSKLSQLWQELKRRKVVRVITVYAAAAFVIIELINNVYEPLRLPDWTPTLIIVLLCIGFIVAVIISWIYDIKPEGGIVRTESAHKVKPEDIPKSSNSWKIASYISFAVIVALIILNIIPRGGNSEERALLDKSIAVLPFKNDSPDKENEYFINGMMESILNNLFKIKDIRVISRSSVEQYRDTSILIPEVAEKLKVSYVLEGSMQKYGNQIRMTLQLIDKNDTHLWSEQYDREIRKVEEIFALHSEIAQLVAGELKAVITPEEKQLIEKISTESQTAYDFYQRGKEEYWKYWLDNDNREALERAEDLYYYALDYDSTFALAYTGLAQVYWDKHYWETYFSENFLDSVPILLDIALSYDDQLAEAYTVKGRYYGEKGLSEQAIKEYDKAIKFNPNDWMAYYYKGRLHLSFDLIRCIDNLQKAASLHRGPYLPQILRDIQEEYIQAGFPEKGKYYGHEVLKLDGDSSKYYQELSAIERYFFDNHTKALDFAEKAHAIDSTQGIYELSLTSMILGQYEESLAYYKKLLKGREDQGELLLIDMQRIGYAYWKNGHKNEAEYYFKKQMEYCINLIELDRSSLYTYYDLAGVYAFLGEKDKAYENLKIFNQKREIHWRYVWWINNDPLFDNIRDEPEFQQIVKDMEAKYQAEHERVRLWLEKNDLL